MKNIRNNNLILSIDKIEYCRADLINLDSPINNLQTQKVYPYGKWLPIYFTKKTATLKQKSSRKNGGVIFNQEIRFKIPGYDGNNTHTSNYEFYYSSAAAIFMPLILRITLCDGTIIIVGRQESPVRLSEEATLSPNNTETTIILQRESVECINEQDLSL